MLPTILFSLPVNGEARLQDPILLLKIHMGTRKNFPENYRQFGYALTKRFASLGPVKQSSLLKTRPNNNYYGKH
jgi:hypothetical protein